MTVHRHAISRTRAGLVLCLVILLTCLVAGSRHLQAQSPPTMAVSPATVVVNAGDTFTVEIIISSDQMMRGGQVGLLFDPAQLEVTGWEEGAFLKNWAQADAGQTMLVPPSPTIDNENGRVSLVAVAIFGGSNEDNGPTGAGTLMIYHLRAKPGAGGQTTLTLGGVLGDPSISDPDGEIMVGLALTHGQIQITPGAVTDTPEPTATPVSTPTPTVASTVATLPSASPSATLPAGTTLTVTPVTKGSPSPAATPSPSPGGGTVSPVPTGTVQRVGAPGSMVAPATTLTATECLTCPSMLLSPASIQVKPGEEFSVEVIISSDRALRGAQVGLLFEPALLEVTGWEEGPLFKDWAAADGGETMLVPPPTIDNELGSVSLVGVAIFGGEHEDEGPSGTGTLFIYHLKARPGASGISTLRLGGELGEVSIADPNGDLVSNLVVGQTQVQVGEGGVYHTLTPTPLPSPVDLFQSTLDQYASIGKGQWKLSLELVLAVGGAVLVVGSTQLTLRAMSGRRRIRQFGTEDQTVRHRVRTVLLRFLAQWPRWVSASLALIPPAMMAFIIVGLVAHSQPALRAYDFSELLGGRFVTTTSPGYNGTDRLVFGMLPGLWGSAYISFVALLTAAPVCLALAILATDFSFGPLNRLISVVIGALAGIPPLYYALVAVGILRLNFIGPKFAGTTIIKIQPSEWPPADMRTPGGGSGGIIVGGITLGLLIIPFIAPLIIDAIKSVPRDLREASWGLGANRWTTLTRVVLRSALPGIATATVLGVLKALGDVLIPSLAIGYIPAKLNLSDVMADSLTGFLAHVPPLTSIGTGLIVSPVRVGTGDVQRAAGSFAGLLLLLIAWPLISLTTRLQERLRKELNQ